MATSVYLLNSMLRQNMKYIIPDTCWRGGKGDYIQILQLAPPPYSIPYHLLAPPLLAPPPITQPPLTWWSKKLVAVPPVGVSTAL